MSPRFSLVYPTRHRPEFVRHALRFLERQGYDDFEVIVSDNYVDPALSCRSICEAADVPGLRYVRPPEPLGMVENWNHAFRQATGEYVCYFTDKMLLLPHTLERAAAAIHATGCEIVSWVDGPYSPARFPEYFGTGSWVYGGPGREVLTEPFAPYDPRAELSLKGRAEVSRNEQDAASYARGKICFGAYSMSLCNRIVEETGALFHPISPDYTSMVLALSRADGAAEIDGPGIVHVSTDLSNGDRCARSDQAALFFLEELGDRDRLVAQLPVPGLYSSQHNLVAHDYAELRRRFGLEFDFDLVRWLAYMAEDLDAPDRVWSSAEVEAEQRGLLAGFVGDLPVELRSRFEGVRAERRQRAEAVASQAVAQSASRGPMALARRTARAVLPNRMREWLRGQLANGLREGAQSSTTIACASIEDVLGARVGPTAKREREAG